MNTAKEWPNDEDNIDKYVNQGELETPNKWLLKHGHRGKYKTSPTYRTWVAMKSRCSNSDNPNYGGRGIEVCASWRDSFSNFLEDMGERPRAHTLDRIDPNGDYEPLNCRWADYQQQAWNRATTNIINFSGKETTLSALAEESGIPKTTIYRRWKQGYRNQDLICKKSKSRLLTGEKSSSSKLSDSQRKEIHDRYIKGEKQADLAREFGVSQPVISDTVKKIKESFANG